MRGRFFYILFFILMGQMAFAQFGFRTKYNQHTYSQWDNIINGANANDIKIFKTGYEAGLDYWFKLKKRRVEFMPEVAYSSARSNLNGLHDIDRITLSGYHFNFNAQIYALDMEGDCDCPTFSKQGPSLNKGLFFHFTPGIGFLTSHSTPMQNAQLESDEVNSLVFKAGIGIGLDIGISDLITITPILSYYFHSGAHWENIPSIETNPGNVTANPKTLQFTLRAGFRPDYANKGRRRRR